jgi:hypothetical protein
MHAEMGHLVDVGNSKSAKSYLNLSFQVHWIIYKSFLNNKRNINYLFSFVTGIALPPGRNSCVINFPMKSSSTENVSDKSETSPAHAGNGLGQFENNIHYTFAFRQLINLHSAWCKLNYDTVPDREKAIRQGPNIKRCEFAPRLGWGKTKLKEHQLSNPFYKNFKWMQDLTRRKQK